MLYLLWFDRPVHRITHLNVTNEVKRMRHLIFLAKSSVFVNVINHRKRFRQFIKNRETGVIAMSLSAFFKVLLTLTLTSVRFHMIRTKH